MATCVELGPGNELIATATAPESCTSFIIQTQPEWASQQFPLWSLTPEQGTEIALAILVVWAIAFVFRQLARALNQIDENPSSE